jgi:hypothetical protein
MGVRDELAKLLLARHTWEQEAAFARATIRHIDKQIAELDARLADEDLDVTVLADEVSVPPTGPTSGSEPCGKLLQTGDRCARERGHELSGTPSGRRHRSQATLDNRAANKRRKRAGGQHAG